MNGDGLRIAKRYVVYVAYLLAMAVVVAGFVHIIDTGRSADVVIDGKADIDYALAEDATIDLNGRWEFYPNQLLTPDDFKSHSRRPDYLVVPRSWQGQYIDGGTYPAEFFGTYRLKLKLQRHAGAPVGLMLDVIRSSSKVYINGSLAGHTGYPGKTFSETVSEIRPATYFFTGHADNEIIIQAANFVNSNRGGIVMPVSFGSAASVYHASVSVIASDVATGIVFIVILAIFAGLYFRRNKEMELLWFSCFCLFSLLLFSAMNSRLLLRLAPYLPYESMAKIAYVSATWSMFSAFMYIRSALKIGMDWLIIMLTSLMLAITAVLILSPLQDLTAYLAYLFRWDAVIALLTTAFMVFGILKRTKGYEYLTFGVVCFIELYLAIMLDYMGMLDSDWFVPIISAVFLVTQLLLIVERHRLNMLEKQQEALELEYLRAQIKPHFIFNALGSIGGLMLEDVTKARRALSDFSRFLRGMFRKENQQDMISLEEELQLAEYYLRIEKVRHGDELEIIVDVPDDLRRERIVPLTIQPLVENSVKHGFGRGADSVLHITIRAAERDGARVIEVIDDGPGISEDGIRKILSGKTPGIGISNTLTRLRRAGGDLLFASSEKGLVVTVVLPVADVRDKRLAGAWL